MQDQKHFPLDIYVVRQQKPPLTSWAFGLIVSSDFIRKSKSKFTSSSSLRVWGEVPGTQGYSIRPVKCVFLISIVACRSWSFQSDWQDYRRVSFSAQMPFSQPMRMATLLRPCMPFCSWSRAFQRIQMRYWLEKECKVDLQGRELMQG